LHTLRVRVQVKCAAGSCVGLGAGNFSPRDFACILSDIAQDTPRARQEQTPHHRQMKPRTKCKQNRAVKNFQPPNQHNCQQHASPAHARAMCASSDPINVSSKAATRFMPHPAASPEQLPSAPTQHGQ